MIRPDDGHAKKAAAFISNAERTHWHDRALWFVRAKRDKAANGLPEWETLREHAAAIKMHTVSKLADYLEQFADNAERRGTHVHWAPDAEAHNRIVLSLLQRHQVRRVVKSKSMLTEECHLNPFLERHGIEVIDTDLGERIVQLRGEPPSHIVFPAIHIRREEIGDLFHEHLGTDANASDPAYLTEAVRQHLRNAFLTAQAGITGVNFAIAETGGFVVCTNEGNADLGTSLPKLHIACMGIEKLIPRVADLAVFLRLLARSATGQPITTYSSHFNGPAEGAELHVVLVDNGRSGIVASEDFRRSLSCIRCGACLNTCPVYRRSGGYSYRATVPGPIGSILAPVRDGSTHHDLPFACSLCGSCTDICPVKIDLHNQLFTLRREMRRQGHLSWSKRISMKLTAWAMSRPRRFRRLGSMGRAFLRHAPRWMVYHRLNPWGKERELPVAPRHSFRELYRKRGDPKEGLGNKLGAPKITKHTEDTIGEEGGS